jgi:hypothetical protein
MNGQSFQDDHFDALATFAETTYIFLTLKAIQQRLTEDELYLLVRAAKVAAVLHGGEREPLHIEQCAVS